MIAQRETLSTISKDFMCGLLIRSPPMTCTIFHYQSERVRPQTNRMSFSSCGLSSLVNMIFCLVLAIGCVTCVDAKVRTPTSINQQSASKRHLSIRQARNLQSADVFISDIQAVIRRVIPRFLLELSPTPQPLTLQDENVLAGIMDNVLVSFVLSKSSLYPDPNTTLDYILLAGIESNEWYTYTGGRNLAGSTTNIAALTFKGGVAYFRGTAAPDASQVTEWVKEGLEQKLPAALVGTPYSYVQSATFTTITSAPSGAPYLQHVADGAQIQQYKSNDSSPSRALISGSVVGGFALLAIALITLLLVRRRSQKGADERQQVKAPRKVESVSSASQVGSDVTNLPPRLQKQKQKSQLPQRPSTPRPVVLATPVPPAPMCLPDKDDDASSFTASTRTDHSNMLPNASGVPRRPYAVTESFQRERHWALRKDMLDSTWNRSTSLGRLHSSPGRPIIQNDTVLQPSYFSASGERRKRKKKPRSDGGDEEQHEEEWYFSESKEEVGKEGFRFESANGGNEGEEVFLVPPSPRSANRPSSSGSTHSLV